MSLNEYMRAVLANWIDQLIKLTLLCGYCKKYATRIKYTNKRRLCSWIYQGSIMRMFISFYRSTYAQNLPPDLQTEVAQIIFRGSRENY